MTYPPSPYAPIGSPVPPLRPVPVIRPSGWWYVAAVGLALLGVVLGGYAVRQGWRDANDAGRDATATALGDEQTITIPRPVSTTVGYSGLELTFTEEDRQDLIDDLDVRIVAAGSGAELPLGTYEGYRPLKSVQQGRDVEYLPLFTVRFDTPGDYVISTRTVPGVNLDDSAVVVSESPFARLRAGLRRAAGFAVGGIAASILVSMILGRTRGRAKRAWAEANPPVPWPPQAWDGQAQAWNGPPQAWDGQAQAWGGPPPSWGPPPGGGSGQGPPGWG